MQNVDSKLNLRNFFLKLLIKNYQIEPKDDAFWEQFWGTHNIKIQDIFILITSGELRKMKDECPQNLSILCNKTIERINLSVKSSCQNIIDQKAVLNCARILTRILPNIFQDEDWHYYFWNKILDKHDTCESSSPLGKTLISNLCDLLFCPEFTVPAHRKWPDGPEDIGTLDSCEFIWENGVGFSSNQVRSYRYDNNRIEILRLILTCLSNSVYQSILVDDRSDSSELEPEKGGSSDTFVVNRWSEYFSSPNNRHTLSIFTSLLNLICSYGHDLHQAWLPSDLRFTTDRRGILVEMCLHIMMAVITYESLSSQIEGKRMDENLEKTGSNLFTFYVSRLHHDEDLNFVIHGFIGLLNDSVPSSTTRGGLQLIPSFLKNPKPILFHQEVMVLLWLFCDINKKFLFHLMKSNQLLDLIVPILYHIEESKTDEAKMGVIHVGVFIILLLSGERNFGVRLNKPYDGPLFKNLTLLPTPCNHADILLLVFHQAIVKGHYKLSHLYESLLIIIVNISPYLKGLSMVTAKKILQLLEGFSDLHFLYAKPYNYRTVYYLLETFNNLIQYQFDGNCNLVYQIIKKRRIFYNLLNLPTDQHIIDDMQANITNEMKRLTNSYAELQVPPINITTPDDGGDINLFGQFFVNPEWKPTQSWAQNLKQKMPLQTILRLLQVLIPQIEKICLENQFYDETEILKFLRHGTLVGLLPVPHPLLIRKYQTNPSTSLWFLTYVWGVIYLKHMDPPIWYDTDIKLFGIK